MAIIDDKLNPIVQETLVLLRKHGLNMWEVGAYLYLLGVAIRNIKNNSKI